MQRINQIIERLKKLELIQNDTAVLVLQPNDDGTYSAVDEAHKGLTLTEEAMHNYGGPVIIWDV